MNYIEYFYGDLYTIYNEIIEIIKYDIIEKYNLDNDIIKDKFRKIDIYFDNNFNSQYFNFIQTKINLNESIQELNYELRRIYQRYIRIDYKKYMIDNIKIEEIPQDVNKEISQNIIQDKNIQHVNKEISQNIIQDSNENIIKKYEKYKKQHNCKELYICHYCVDYITNNENSMKKHYQRKNKCNCFSKLLYEMAENLSLNKKFIFTFNYSNLFKNDILFIINHYTNKYNVIHKNYKKNIINNNFIIDNKNDNNEDNEDNEDNISLSDFNIKYYNYEQKCYQCPNCLTEFTRKYNLIKHLDNKKSCLYKQNIKNLVKEAAEKEQMEKERLEKERLEKERLEKERLEKERLEKENYNVISFDKNYDISHIDILFYSKKDFYIYNVFLEEIIKNKINRNIYFVNKQAVIYIDNSLIRSEADKSIYYIITNLENIIDKLYDNKNNYVIQNYNNIKKYYNELKNSYVNDLLYKEYNIYTYNFNNILENNILYCRDKYFLDTINIINIYHKEIYNNINKKNYFINEIYFTPQYIKNYASTKMRYRDLKDSNKW